MAKILICIDHKWRDLPGYVYAKYMLELKGHRVEFIRNGLEKYYVTVLKPDIIVLINLYETRLQEFAKEMKRSGIKVVMMPTEGIPTLKMYRAFASGALNDMSGIHTHFVWNTPMAKELQSNKTLSTERINIVGVPRFDFYRLPLSNTLVTKEKFCEKYQLDKNKKIITFATNFTQASFHTHNKEFFLDDAKRLGYKNIYDEKMGDVSEVPRRDYESRKMLVEAFVQLVKDMPDISFLLKLHPSEDHQFYNNIINSELVDQIHRVRILSNEYIWDVLNVTDIELKRSCTTGIESWLLGKPTLEMKLNTDEWYFSEEHASGSDVVTSYEELVNKVNYYLNGGKVLDNLVKARNLFVETWCFSVDGKATSRMVDELVKISHDKNNITLKYSLKNRIFIYILFFNDYLIHDFKVYGIFNVLRKRYIDKLGRNDKYYHNRDVRYWYKKISDIFQ